MKGTTHAAIGGVIGATACLRYAADVETAAYFMTVGVFSALAADLDGSSMLTAKLGKLSRHIREWAVWGGLLALAIIGYLYLDTGHVYPAAAAIAATVSLLGIVSKVGVIRNALISVIGAVAMYFGWKSGQTWLVGLGAFVGAVPWLDHRGMTHTVWAVAVWGWIGYELERQLRMEGIMLTAIAGYVSHLVADTLTPQGVKWFYPIIKKSIKIG